MTENKSTENFNDNESRDSADIESDDDDINFVNVESGSTINTPIGSER